MSWYSLDRATALGDGKLARAGSVTDPELVGRVSAYKRSVAGRYRAISPDEVHYLPTGPMLVSPKVDGQFWCLVIDGDGETRDVALVAPNGKVIVGAIPLLAEARRRVAPRARGRLVVAGELFALRRDGRPRVYDVTAALGGGADAEVGRLGFFAFDLIGGGDGGGEEAEAEPPAEYPQRLAMLQRLFEGGQRLQAIRSDEVHSHAEVEQKFADWVDGGQGEGLVIRPADGRIFKLKPIFTLDAAVIGFTEQTDAADHVRSLLLAVMRDNGQFQLVGSCGNLGSDEFRGQLYEQLTPDVVESSYRFASSTGALFRFVAPKMVVEVKMTDVQVEDPGGRAIRRMVLEYDEDGGWAPAQLRAGISMIHPIFVRVRDDKQVELTDIRATQVLERTPVPELDKAVPKIERPVSEVVRREVYVKTTKGQQAVRKLLVWKTNKDEVDASYPAYVVHWTDYSPGRKVPLQREVRLAADAAAAEELAAAMIESGVKRGWQPAEQA